MKLFSFLSLCLVFTSTIVFADSFPSTLSYSLGDKGQEEGVNHLEGDDLRLQGVAERSILFFSIYEIALYLKDGATKDDYPLALSLKYSRDLSKSSIESALRKGLKKNTEEEQLSSVLAVFDTELLPKLRDVKEGESLRLIRLSSSKAKVQLNGNFAGLLQGEVFLNALFSIWLGDNSVVTRDELFSGFK